MLELDLTHSLSPVNQLGDSTGIPSSLLFLRLFLLSSWFVREGTKWILSLRLGTVIHGQPGPHSMGQASSWGELPPGIDGQEPLAQV